MTDLTPEALAALLAAGAGVATPASRVVVEPGVRQRVLSVVPAGWHVDDTLVDTTSLLPVPERRKGTYTVDDAPSFAALWAKHAGPASEVYAALGSSRSPGDQEIVAVLNDNAGSGADWRDHRIVWKVRPHPEWSFWLNENRHDKLLPQGTFAEHIEAGMAQIVEPDGATMLSVAEGLHGGRNVEWGSRATRHDGLVTFTYKETGGAQVSDGAIDVPQRFRLALRPFAGSGITVQPWAVFRYRFSSDTGLTMAYKFLDLDSHIEAGVRELLKELGDALTPMRAADPGGEPVVQILRGRP